MWGLKDSNLPCSEAADLQSAPMPSLVTTPFYHCRIENLNKDNALITSFLLLNFKNCSSVCSLFVAVAGIEPAITSL